jgi:hypothetical protein
VLPGRSVWCASKRDYADVIKHAMPGVQVHRAVGLLWIAAEYLRFIAALENELVEPKIARETWEDDSCVFVNWLVETPERVARNRYAYGHKNGSAGFSSESQAECSFLEFLELISVRDLQLKNRDERCRKLVGV